MAFNGEGVRRRMKKCELDIVVSCVLSLALDSPDLKQLMQPMQYQSFSRYTLNYVIRLPNVGKIQGLRDTALKPQSLSLPGALHTHCP